MSEGGGGCGKMEKKEGGGQNRHGRSMVGYNVSLVEGDAVEVDAQADRYCWGSWVGSCCVRERERERERERWFSFVVDTSSGWSDRDGFS